MARSENKAVRYICLSIFILSAFAMLACEIFKSSLFGDSEFSEMLYSLSSRFFGIVLCIVLVFYCNFEGILKLGTYPVLKGILAVIPCWVIALNNFPVIPVMLGQARITSSYCDIFLYAIVCLFVGIFEELAYRGCVFMLILKNNRRTRSDIFRSVVISSALFGAVHIVNLFAGSGPIPVLLQVGYSFLIGAMCSFVLLKTGSIWHCALIHAVYNFCGGIVANYGEGSIWTVPEIALTVVVSILVTAYVFIAFCKTDPKEAACLFAVDKMM